MTDTATNDHDLVQRFQAGDMGAAELLYRRHYEGVRTMVWRMLRGAPETDDLVHDVFVRALRGLNGFQARSSFRTWLYQIAGNTVLNHLERRERAPFAGSLDEPVSAHDGTTRADLTPSPVAPPETQTLRRELSDAIQAAVDRLAPPYRLALIMRDIQGLAYDEIAEALDVSLGTVKSRIARARAQVQDQLRTYV